MMQLKVRKPTRHNLYLFMLILISLLLISACVPLLPPEPLPPTPTSTITTTPTPTIDWFPATPTSTLMAIASATPQPTREGQMIGLTELLAEDNFADPDSWETRQSESGNIAYGNQNLTLAVAKPSTSVLSLSQYALPEDFAVEMTIQASLCAPEDQIGILFWHQSNSDYFRLLLNCSGQYRLELIQGGQSFVLYDWERATQMQLAIPSTNRIGMRVYRGQFQFYINDRFQFEAEIAKDETGSLGIFARTISGNAMTVRFSDLKIYNVESN
mgnify:CR=1 FL=1